MRVGLIQALGRMARLSVILKSAMHRSWLVALLSLLLAAPVIYLLFHVELSREIYPVVMKYVYFAAQPWLTAMDAVMGGYGLAVIHTDLFVGLISIFVSANITLAYILVRFGWLLLRPNNSFKPNPQQGGA